MSMKLVNSLRVTIIDASFIGQKHTNYNHMKVLKFGGTSVGTAANIDKVKKIVHP